MASALRTTDEVADEIGERVVLSPAERKELLGRLAEFEMQLLALPPREQGFVLAYVSDPTSHAAAARRAGCPEKNSHVHGARLLAKPRVAAAIATGMNIREDRTMVTADRTIHEIATIAFSDITMFEVRNGEIDVKDGVPKYMLRAIQSADLHEEEFRDTEGNVVRVERSAKIKLWSKTDSLRMLALYQKLIVGTQVNVLNDNRSIHVHEWQWGDKKLAF